MNIIHLYFFVFFNQLLHIIGFAKKENNKSIGIFCLLNKPSFRLLDEQHDNNKTIFKFIKDILDVEVKKDNVKKTKEILVFEESNAASKRKDYLNYVVYGDIDMDFIGRTQLLYFDSNLEKILFFLISVFNLPFLVLLSLKKQTIPGNLGLLHYQVIEIANFLKHSNLNYQKIHLFNMYENDMNLLGYLLLKKNKPFIKHPSPGPLMAHNKWIVTDELAIEIPYQKEELMALEFCSYNKLVDYLPENGHNYLELYKKGIDSPKGTIGFYSHAGWLRAKQKRQKTVFAKPEYEEKLLNWMNLYFKDKKSNQIVVFLHPKEMHEDVILETTNYYSSMLFNINYRISNTGEPNHNTFAEVEIAISYYSTILFERLLCGFKSFCYVKGLKGFPIKQSSLDQICFNDFPELEHKIKDLI